ncbi:helix-turn-helix domain-containing protein [Streptomyces rubiginosohelvolus]|uniref:helix-turn-helix domain-containing protein n=1 Tax=Streptomyces rubiginosohelvolus TaxID=67362 RepID=UPI0037FBA06B
MTGQGEFPTTLAYAPEEPGTGYWPYKTREELAAALVAEYDDGASIRDLVALHGICFGTVQRLLREGGAVMRSRGDTRRPYQL